MNRIDDPDFFHQGLTVINKLDRVFPVYYCAVDVYHCADEFKDDTTVDLYYSYSKFSDSGIYFGSEDQSRPKIEVYSVS